MRSLLLALAAVAGLTALCGPTAHAMDTAYVTDRLEVTLRRGTGTQFAILAMLPAGQRLEVLDTDEQTGYTQVRTPQGTEGWVLTRYLQAEPAARERLAEVEARLAQALEQRGSAGELLDDMTAERDALAERVEALETEEARLGAELAELRDAAGDTLAVHERNRELQEAVDALEEQVVNLRVYNRELERQTQRDWFVAGAAVLLTGLVLGLVLPRIRWRRRSSWGEL